jgi:branched-chain amino acid transport system substrate-binding protein
MDRRKFVSSTAALGGLAAFGAFGPASAQGKGPIKIGLLTPLTGVVASGGKEIQEGFELYWNQVGHKIAGREVQVFV